MKCANVYTNLTWSSSSCIYVDAVPSGTNRSVFFMVHKKSRTQFGDGPSYFRQTCQHRSNVLSPATLWAVKMVWLKTHTFKLILVRNVFNNNNPQINKTCCFFSSSPPTSRKDRRARLLKKWSILTAGKLRILQGKRSAWIRRRGWYTPGD